MIGARGGPGAVRPLHQGAHAPCRIQVAQGQAREAGAGHAEQRLLQLVEGHRCVGALVVEHLRLHAHAEADAATLAVPDGLEERVAKGVDEAGRSVGEGPPGGDGGRRIHRRSSESAATAAARARGTQRASAAACRARRAPRVLPSGSPASPLASISRRSASSVCRTSGLERCGGAIRSMGQGSATRPAVRSRARANRQPPGGQAQSDPSACAMEQRHSSGRRTAEQNGQMRSFGPAEYCPRHDWQRTITRLSPPLAEDGLQHPARGARSESVPSTLCAIGKSATSTSFHAARTCEPSRGSEKPSARADGGCSM